MQTHKEILEKVAALEEDLQEQVVREITRLLSTGAVNLEEYANDFYLPKILYTQALRNISNGYAPLDKAGCRLLQNLTRF